ncbi:MAG: hypothetical protein K6G75_04950 [Lachnospiraceae bacterium]|nr:hypothetical protein [Lachnospiraceae bacterium]
MKTCPHCKINIGGNLEKCPLCQNSISGEGERDYWPKIKLKTRKRYKAFKIVLFSVIAIIIINLAVDFLFLNIEHLSWSPIVVIWLLGLGWLVEFIIRKHYNLLKTLFLSMITVSLLCMCTELFVYSAWELPKFPAITPEYIIPGLCSANIIAYFVLSFIDKHFIEHSMIFMFLNILVGVIPWIVLLFVRNGHPPFAWSVCLVVNCLALAGLAVFKGRTVISEFKKRFHM